MQGDIRREHKTNSDSSERQYIAKVRETVFSLHCTFEFETTRMAESLIDLVHQYPAQWDKQNSKYKDSNYKDAKWREIAEMLGVPKDDAIKKWKSLRDTYVRQKNIKGKSVMLQISSNLHTYIQAYYFHNVAICKKS